MECGSQEILCHVLTWATENELAARKLNDLLVRMGHDASGGLGAAAAFLKDYGQLLVGLLGFSFGFYRWWLYRDRILHKRLDEYISARDARLRDVRGQALETVQRPAPGQSLQSPSFIDRELAAVLRENRWDSTALTLTVHSSAEWQLGKAIENIKRKLQTAEREAVSLRQELCTAYSLRGAVASACGGDSWHSVALSHFRNALSLPGHDTDIEIRELEAHQLRKLKLFREARRGYERVIDLSASMGDGRRRDVIKARATRYLAEMEGVNVPRNALQMMTAELSGSAHSPGAIALLEKCHPLNAWELVEKGDMHYFAASLANRLRFAIVERSQLGAAATAYQNALLSLRKERWKLGRSTSRLRKFIKDGRKRVLEAQFNEQYDTAWLPPLQQAEQKAADVSASGSKQAVPETA